MKNQNLTNQVNKSAALNKLVQSGDIWRASRIKVGRNQGIPSGYPVLDKCLPGSGWPSNGLTELLHDKNGLGELSLLMPALARLSQEQNRWLLWLAPPYIPYAPTLAKAGIHLDKVLIVNTTNLTETLWVLEKALASKSCSAVLAWPTYSCTDSTSKLTNTQEDNLKEKQLRRLQIACKEGHCWGVLFRHNNAAKNASPAELRIQLESNLEGNTALQEHADLQLKILK